MGETEDKLIELEFEYTKTKDRMLIYLDILNNISTSIDEVLQREKENIRFNFDEEIDYRECLINLNKMLKEYKRVYKIDF
jgi:hypothetical protein